jgi:L-alanine-DL-glutamate epimerase-like enolase superfamily enzyme
MKITAVDSFVLRVPTSRPIALEFPEHRLVVATIHTDEGLTGLGYSLAFGGGGAEAIQVYLATRLAPLVLGQDPLFVERLWERMFRADRGIKRQGVAAYALAALDIGLWDLAGKIAGLPLYKLWGAVRDRIPAYGSGGWPSYSVEDLITEATRYVSMGCRYYKMKVHHPDPRENRRRVEAVRKAVGDGVRLMVDVNQKLDVLGAIRQAELLEDLDLVWYEEPVLAEDIDACAEVAQAIRIPVATGENAYTRFEFRELIARRAARYLSPTSAAPTASARRSGSATSRRRTRSRSRHTSSTSCHSTWSAPSPTASSSSSSTGRLPTSSPRCRAARTATSGSRTALDTASRSLPTRNGNIGSASTISGTSRQLSIASGPMAGPRK